MIHRPRNLFLILLSAVFLMTGCIDARELPTEPLEKGVELTSNVADWRDEVIYQVLVDRFDDGDINNNFNVDTRAPARYHGGDWQGLINRLGYLQSLGVTTVWITPVVRNVEEDAGFASYHGYWTQDFLKHNPHFGSLNDLRRLSDALHAKGMKLILDVVTNHVGQAFFYDINGNGRPDEFLSGSSSADDADPLSKIERISEYDPDFDRRGVQGRTSLGEFGVAPVIFFEEPSVNRLPPGPQNIDLNGDGKIEGADEILGFSNPNWYHRMGRVTDWDSNKPEGYLQGEQTLYGDFPGGLKDVATENPAVQTAMKLVFSYWIDAADADGFRIDTLKHIKYEFWQDWAPAMRSHALGRGKNNFFLFGEVFDGNDQLLGSYTGPGQVDSVFYFSQKFRVFDNLFKCPAGNEARICRNDDGTYKAGGTQAVEDLYQDRLLNYNSEPQENGLVSGEGEPLNAQQTLVNFIDNHDVSRYLFERDDEKGVASLHNALFYLLTEDGIPCIYYGTEQAFFGGNDPANREDMNVRGSSLYARDTNYKTWSQTNPTFLHIQRLTKIRRENVVMRRGDMKTVWSSQRVGNESDAGILAFERSTSSERALIVINTHEAQESRTEWDNPEDAEPIQVMTTGFASGTVLIDIFAEDRPEFSVGAGGSLVVSVPALSGRVLIPR